MYTMDKLIGLKLNKMSIINLLVIIRKLNLKLTAVLILSLVIIVDQWRPFVN